MKKLIALMVIAVFPVLSAFASEDGGKGPDIRIIDNKVSIQADAVPLGRLLRLLDQVTGMTSKVPTDLANRNISVRFSNLSFDDAIQKIFEGQSLDYFVVPGRGIQVPSVSLPPTRSASTAPYSPPPPENNTFVEDSAPFVPPQPPANNANPPAMIQTPFGAIPNPNARNGQQNQQQGVSPMVMPGQIQNNPYNQGLPGFNQPNSLPPLQSNPQFGQPAQPATNPGSAFPPFPTTQPGTAFPGPNGQRPPNP